jgi:hypothetical protein
MSYGSVGNAPPLVVGTLLRRADPTEEVPHILFVLTAGSVCWQIDLMADHLDDHLPPVPLGLANIKWETTLGDGAERSIRIKYSNSRHFDWSSRDNQPQPIESVVIDFCWLTCEGRLTPVFRT